MMLPASSTTHMYVSRRVGVTSQSVSPHLELQRSSPYKDFMKHRSPHFTDCHSTIDMSSNSTPTTNREGVNKVRRKLFGVNHDENNKFLERELKTISEIDRKKWNFNFSKGIPEEGDYEWSIVPESSYRYGSLTSSVCKRKRCDQDIGEKQNDKENESVSRTTSPVKERKQYIPGERLS